MSEVADFSALLASVYDAALDKTLWSPAIERSASFLRCMGGMIGAYDVLQKGADVRAAWGYEQQFLDSFDHYTAINPTLRPSFRMKVGEVMSIGDLVSMHEFRKSAIHREWAAPQGIVDVVQTHLEKTPLALAALAFSRHKRHGLVDDETRRRMALIAPHFRRALLIGKVVDLARIETAAFANAIDGLAAAVFLVDATGRLLHSNAAAEAILASGDPLRTVDGILTANTPAVDRRLAVSFAAAAEGDTAVEAHGIAVPMASASGERFTAHVLPMISGRRRDAGVAHAAVAALFARKIERDFPSAVRSMAEIYRLTSSEVRVLHVVLEVGGIAPAALMLRLSENTVKTHLQRIFRKTGARNQVDLVKLAAGLSSPIIQPS